MEPFVMNMLETIVPKSDQLNADDLLGGRAMTITITGVDIKMDEQPVAIRFEGDNNKPYRPGKSMRRVLVNVWGPDANVYIGRKLTLYRDDSVKFGGMDVGGIRISHMSHITEPVTMALTATKAQRRPFTVRPLKDDGAPPSPKFPTLDEEDGGKWLKNLAALVSAVDDPATIDEIQAHASVAKANEKAPAHIKSRIAEIFEKGRARLKPQATEESTATKEDKADDTFPGDLPSREAAE